MLCYLLHNTQYCRKLGNKYTFINVYCCCDMVFILLTYLTCIFFFHSLPLFAVDSVVDLNQYCCKLTHFTNQLVCLWNSAGQLTEMRTWFGCARTFYFLPVVVILMTLFLLVEDNFHILPYSRSLKKHFVFDIAQWKYDRTCEHRNKRNRLECQTCIVKVAFCSDSSHFTLLSIYLSSLSSGIV